MRSRLLLPLALSLTAAGCFLYSGCATDDIKETGISRATAIRIAERHCSEYPDTWDYVDRAEWDPDGKFWRVAITDRDGDHGRAYKVGPGGGIIGSHSIDRSSEDHYYGPSHYWYYW